MFDRDRNANSCSSNGVRPVHRQKKKIRKKKGEKSRWQKFGEKNKMKQKKKLYNMITSDIKKLLFSPSCRLVQEPHTEAGLERRWGGTIVITIRRKKKQMKIK